MTADAILLNGSDEPEELTTYPIFCAYGLSSFIAAVVAKALIGEEIENCCPVDIDFDGLYLNKNS